MKMRLVMYCIIPALIACKMKVGEFVVKDVSKPHQFMDSTFFNADCCVSTMLSGELDGDAWVIINAHPQGWWLDSIYIPSGVVRTKESRGDFYSHNKIRIRYIPGKAKKGYVKIRSQIF